MGHIFLLMIFMPIAWVIARVLGMPGFEAFLVAQGMGFAYLVSIFIRAFFVKDDGGL
jgi:hypothetical protein